MLLADGSEKPIEEVCLGDVVFADDPEDEEGPGEFAVSATFKNYTFRLIHIAIDRDGDGNTDGEFRATGEHPVWTQSRGWQDAEDLAPGDVLQDASQRGVIVVRTWEEETESATHNLTVEGVNTFFIVVDGVSILVHNTEYDIVPFRPTTTPNFNHHGLLHRWLEVNMQGIADVYGNPAYRGRSETKFPTIELSAAAHARATAYEVKWRAAYRKQHGIRRIDWSHVSAREMLEASKGTLNAAGVPKNVQDEYFGKVNNWLYKKFCP